MKYYVKPEPLFVYGNMVSDDECEEAFYKPLIGPFDGPIKIEDNWLVDPDPEAGGKCVLYHNSGGHNWIIIEEVRNRCVPPLPAGWECSWECSTFEIVHVDDAEIVPCNLEPQEPFVTARTFRGRELHVYKVGMGTDICMIEAPSAKAASMFYAVRLVNTNNHFMAAVYSCDGEEVEDSLPWGKYAFQIGEPTDEEIDKLSAELKAIGDDVREYCRVIEEEKPENA